MVVFSFVVMTGKRAGEYICFVVCTSLRMTKGNRWTDVMKVIEETV